MAEHLKFKSMVGFYQADVSPWSQSAIVCGTKVLCCSLGVEISSFFVRFGVLGFGLYPLGLELAVEAIFPLDESAGTIFIFLFGQISALVVISLKGPLAQNLPEEDGNIQVM